MSNPWWCLNWRIFRKFLIPASIKPSYFPPKVVRCNEWQRRSRDKSHLGMVGLNEDPAKDYDNPWLTWRCLNRLHTGYTCSREQRNKWGYFNGNTTCACRMATENTGHMLQYSLLSHHCTLYDILKYYVTMPSYKSRVRNILASQDLEHYRILKCNNRIQGNIVNKHTLTPLDEQAYSAIYYYRWIYKYIYIYIKGEFNGTPTHLLDGYIRTNQRLYSTFMSKSIIEFTCRRSRIRSISRPWSHPQTNLSGEFRIRFR